jgi:hypothetical protein
MDTAIPAARRGRQGKVTVGHRAASIGKSSMNVVCVPSMGDDA